MIYYALNRLEYMDILNYRIRGGLYMGADIISILFFVTAIVLAFIRKINIGIVALALAVPCTMLIGMPGKEVINGVNGHLFITLVGITLLFSIVNDTGALGLLAHKIVAIAGQRLWLIPILLFVAGGFITGGWSWRYSSAGYHDSYGDCRWHKGWL